MIIIVLNIIDRNKNPEKSNFDKDLLEIKWYSTNSPYTIIIEQLNIFESPLLDCLM